MNLRFPLANRFVPDSLPDRLCGMGSGFFARKLVALLLSGLLAGCASEPTGRDESSLLSATANQTLPPARFAAECDKLWQTDDKDSLSDADYWLRAMECAERMTPSQARLEAAGNEGESWDDAFRESVLLNSAGISIAERRRAYQRLLGYRSRIPPAVYPVFKMWRQQEALRLILADERAKNQRQQDAAAAQIEQMRQQQLELQSKLDITTRKLENLTEIERRLSARKQGMQDSGDNDAADPPSTVTGPGAASGGKTAPAAKP